MATISNSITNILRTLQDEGKTNYQSNELLQYFDQAVGFLSRELAKWGSRIGVENTTLTYSAGDYSEALPTDFLVLALNEQGEHRVFNASNDYAKMGREEISSLDDWESETAVDDGTPSAFIIDGLNLIIHPRPEDNTTIKLYYHPLKSAGSESSEMPWGGWFNGPIEQFVLRQCRLRSEMTGMFQIDVADYERLAQQCRELFLLRENNTPAIRFGNSIGWS